MPPKIVSFNLTSSQEFSLNEVQIFADFSSQATHWTEWSDWSKCGPECSMVNGQPKGEQMRKRSCLNYRHHESVCVGDQEETRKCDLGLCNNEGNVKER